MHDAGINLPFKETTQDQKKFLFRYAPEATEAIPVLRNWDRISEHMGYKPEEDDIHPLLQKEGLRTGQNILSLFSYDGAQNMEFARVAAQVGVKQSDYLEHEKAYLTSLKKEHVWTIPSPKVEEKDNFKLFQLDRDDPRGVFGGQFTGCCQHPDGVGQDCAWHGQSNPNGAFWGVEKRGDFVAIAWVWRHDDNLVIDNVNVNVRINSNGRNVIRDLYQNAAEDVVDKLGVQKVYLGTGYSGIPIVGKQECRPFPAPRDADGDKIYNDSDKVVLLAERQLLKLEDLEEDKEDFIQRMDPEKLAAIKNEQMELTKRSELSDLWEDEYEMQR